MNATADASIVVEHVDKTYYPSPGWMKAMVKSNITEPVVALRDIDFVVGPGEIVAVVGPNGAGKTTTFRILVGLTTPTGGKASVMGYDAEKDSVAVRSLVGWMPGDDRSLLMRLTCEENLRFHGRMQGMKGKGFHGQIQDTLELVGLGHAAKKSIFALSAGMRARMQLARALLHDPRVLILDEPTGAVDPVAAHGLIQLITSIVVERRLAALVSSHRLEEIEALQSRVILLDAGRIRYDGALDALRLKLDRPCIELEFAAAETAMRAAAVIGAARPHAHVEVVDGRTVRCVLSPGTSAGDVLGEVPSFIADLRHMREVKRPLRDLLADIYSSDESGEPRGVSTGATDRSAGMRRR